MDQGGNGAEDDRPRHTLSPRLITASPRKFSKYALDPDHPSGKAGIFVDRFGYRPHSEEDATELAAMYVAQASDGIRAGDFMAGQHDEFGQRYTIPIVVRGVTMLSGWLLRLDGTLALVTPFAGFGRERQEGPR